MLTSRIREAGWEGIDDFTDPLERVSAPYYGVDPEELWRRASAKEHIASARVPVLVLHPEDDQVIPVEHARILDQAAKGNELVRVWVLPGGGHGDRRCRPGVVLRGGQGFLQRWAEWGRDDASAADAGQDRAGAS